jgi:predicted dehydrogenase
MYQEPTNRSRDSRRNFLKQGAWATATVGASVASLARALPVHAAGDDTLRVGLVGCGGRGTGAATQALRADSGARLTAMADLFPDRLDMSLAAIQKESDIAAKIDVPAERRFSGIDAFQRLLDSHVDVVLLATPPHFRPAHLEAAVEAGVHIFAEKPVAVDAPGVRRALAACIKAAEKDVSVVSGLCLRYHLGFREIVRRIQTGQIGQITTLYANDYRGTLWLKARQPDWTDMHNQMRNWYYYTWLCGDFNVEQHVHFLDVCAWIMGDRYPAKAVGLGGRQQRTQPEYGNIYDHHSVVYEYADGARLVSNCRQMKGCQNDMSVQVAGTRGTASIREKRGGITIQSDEGKWAYDGLDNDIYQTEHDELFAAIRARKPINNGSYMAHSTLLAILGRMATYTGDEITWEQALNSQEDLTPPSYAWGPAPEVKIAIPGESKFT